VDRWGGIHHVLPTLGEDARRKLSSEKSQGHAVADDHRLRRAGPYL